eukprot:9988652-Alexandrium_andersonii.AAC.1
MAPRKQQPRATLFADSDWAGDKSTRKSVDCVVADVRGAVVYVSTKGQSFLALSSPEAELAGAHRGSLYGIFLQNMWKEIPDSSSGLEITAGQGVGAARHLDIEQ